jgi:hypothetical protein
MCFLPQARNGRETRAAAAAAAAAVERRPLQDRHTVQDIRDESNATGGKFAPGTDGSDNRVIPWMTPTTFTRATVAYCVASIITHCVAHYDT